jgi:hypothetical protein
MEQTHFLEPAMVDDTPTPPDIEQPQRGYTTQDVQSIPETPPPRRRRRRWKLWVAGLLLLPLLLIALWTWITMTYTYSEGQRVGFMQKLSRKGWLCKTWEGELAMANVPGQVQEKWYFTVRDNAVAQRVQESEGRRVALTYEEHKGIPFSCFGDTRYFVTGVKVVE